MGNENSTNITKEDLIEIQKKQLKLEEQNKKIQQDLLRQKKANEKLQKIHRSSVSPSLEKQKESKSSKKVSFKIKDTDISLDPYGIFGVDSDISLDDLKIIYKKLLVKYHPDKSGYDSSEEYKIIQKAYKMIVTNRNEEERINNRQNLTSNQILEERDEFDKNLDKTNLYFQPSSGNNFNNSKFNQMFDQYKFVDETANKGYSDWLKNDKDFSNTKQPIVNSIDKLNSAFDEYIQKVADTKQVVEYIDPENEISTSANYDYLVSDLDDFTKHGHYTDVKKAYTEKNILHPGQTKSRENFTSIEQLKQSRSAPMTLSKEEEFYLEQKKNKELERENERNQKLRDRDKNIENFYTQIHGRAIELPSYKK